MIPTTFNITHPDVQIYALASDWGIYMNGRMIPGTDNKAKSQLLKALKALKPADKAIILHVDMLTEGIDVPGITGIMPMRNLGKIKFMQTLGRAVRLYLTDRDNIDAGIIEPNQRDKYIKQLAWVIIPDVMINGDDAKSRYKEFVDSIRTEYEFKSNELTIIDDANGVDEEETDDPEYIGVKETPEEKLDKSLKTTKEIAFTHKAESLAEIAQTMNANILAYATTTMTTPPTTFYDLTPDHRYNVTPTDNPLYDVVMVN